MLFLGCHLDDVEFGCGGLLSQLAKKDVQIHIAVLSASNKNANGEIQLERDRSEAYSALRQLGLPENTLYIGSCYGQIFDQTPQKVREELLELRRRFQPKVVFYPACRDIHQDHGVLAENAFRIFRNVSCFGYEIVRSTFNFHPTVYVGLSEENVDNKIRSVLTYRSQQKQSAGYYFNAELLRACTVFRGGQCDMPYAEAFECYRIIVSERGNRQ